MPTAWIPPCRFFCGGQIGGSQTCHHDLDGQMAHSMSSGFCQPGFRQSLGASARSWLPSTKLPGWLPGTWWGSFPTIWITNTLDQVVNVSLGLPVLFASYDSQGPVTVMPSEELNQIPSIASPWPPGTHTSRWKRPSTLSRLGRIVFSTHSSHEHYHAGGLCQGTGRNQVLFLDVLIWLPLQIPSNARWKWATFPAGWRNW